MDNSKLVGLVDGNVLPRERLANNWNRIAMSLRLWLKYGYSQWFVSHTHNTTEYTHSERRQHAILIFDSFIQLWFLLNQKYTTINNVEFEGRKEEDGVEEGKWDETIRTTSVKNVSYLPKFVVLGLNSCLQFDVYSMRMRAIFKRIMRENKFIMSQHHAFYLKHEQKRGAHAIGKLNFHSLNKRTIRK